MFLDEIQCHSFRFSLCCNESLFLQRGGMGRYNNTADVGIGKSIVLLNLTDYKFQCRRYSYSVSLHSSYFFFAHFHYFCVLFVFFLFVKIISYQFIFYCSKCMYTQCVPTTMTLSPYESDTWNFTLRTNTRIIL